MTVQDAISRITVLGKARSADPEQCDQMATEICAGFLPSVGYDLQQLYGLESELSWKPQRTLHAPPLEFWPQTS